MVEKKDEKNQEKPVETPPSSDGKIVTYSNTNKKNKPDITPQSSDGIVITEEKEKN